MSDSVLVWCFTGVEDLGEPAADGVTEGHMLYAYLHQKLVLQKFPVKDLKPLIYDAGRAGQQAK